jgi:hypothetical protein
MNSNSIIIDVLISIIPLIALAAVTWRLVWPKWKLIAKLVLHPIIYGVLSFYIGHWSILFAWAHQSILGLGVHIRFCQKNGFTWYAVEDPERYVQLSKASIQKFAGASTKKK